MKIFPEVNHGGRGLHRQRHDRRDCSFRPSGLVCPQNPPSRSLQSSRLLRKPVGRESGRTLPPRALYVRCLARRPIGRYLRLALVSQSLHSSWRNYTAKRERGGRFLSLPGRVRRWLTALPDGRIIEGLLGNVHLKTLSTSATPDYSTTGRFEGDGCGVAYAKRRPLDKRGHRVIRVARGMLCNASSRRFSAMSSLGSGLLVDYSKGNDVRVQTYPLGVDTTPRGEQFIKTFVTGSVERS